MGCVGLLIGKVRWLEVRVKMLSHHAFLGTVNLISNQL